MATMGVEPRIVDQPYGGHYPSHSVMEDVSDSESDPDLEAELDPDQQRFYEQQRQQAMYYQQHTSVHGSTEHVNVAQQRMSGMHGQAMGDGMDDEEMYSDDESSTASIPDENIDFSLTYALHTFLATVEGQASVVKGDSLLLLDDANSYWWLVRVLKTEDVGYIPAENIETPNERLARLNKHRNVDLAAATMQERQTGEVQGRERLKGAIAGRARGLRTERSGNDGAAKKGVKFGQPTFVDHPGVTWSSDEESDEGSYDEEDEEDEGGDIEQVDRAELEGEYDDHPDGDVLGVEEALGAAAGSSMLDMEPDDGVEWAEDSATRDQKRSMDQRQQQAQYGQQSQGGGMQMQPGSRNPFAQQQHQPEMDLASGYGGIQSPSTSSNISSPGSAILDPAQANGTRRITATPAVAGGPQPGPLLPSALHNQNTAMNGRNASGQSIASVSSMASIGSTSSAGGGASPQDEGGRKMKKQRKSSKEDLKDDGSGEKRKSKSMLGGLFSRNKKDKKGIASSDPRNSEDSIVSGAMDISPGSRMSEDSPGQVGTRAPTPGSGGVRGPVIGIGNMNGPPQVSAHGARLAQKDQALQQAYTTKYLNKSPSGDVGLNGQPDPNAVTQSSMRLAATINAPNNGRPSSIILSPNPAGPPLLNVIRVFAGEHIKSEASFKTVLLNETTSTTDLMRQLMQRFRLLHASTPGADSGYFLTIKDFSGEEMELEPSEKPLLAFQDAVQRWSSDEDDSGRRLGAITPTVKRSSISSISSVVSLSNHPAIAKLGMQDFQDDSAVKIYFNRRRPGSQQRGLPEPNSEFSSYSTHLSTVQESSPDSKVANWGESAPATPSTLSDVTATPPTPQEAPSQRYNPSLTISTHGQASPERFSSPSAKFTIQLLINRGDLPDSVAFDPMSEAIVPRELARERQHSATMPMESRKRLFILPRNVTAVEAIEQGLERFGIQDGVVDGGDDVEARGRGRSGAKVKYILTAVRDGEERQLMSSSKVLDAYVVPPQLRPAERTTMAERRRSRDHSMNVGQPSDILATDPTFVLRRVGPRTVTSPTPTSANDARRNLASPTAHDPHTPLTADVSRMEAAHNNGLSPQEIIAAQRAATRANQRALISAHTNTNQGVDLVLPDKGTLRSSRLLEPNGAETVRYSFIDDNGETYDISEIIAEEWGSDDANSSSPNVPQAPALTRHGDSSTSNYVTAPSTPMEEPHDQMPTPRGSEDILRGVLARAQGQPEGRLEEKLQRVISKVKSWRPLRSPTSDRERDREREQGTSSRNGRATPASGGRATPQDQRPPSNSDPNSRTSTPQPPGGLQTWNDESTDMTPRARRPSAAQSNENKGSEPMESDSRSGSRQNNYQDAAASVNRIISRHHQRQQPSIASIMSDLSASPAATSTESARERVSREPSLDPMTESREVHHQPQPNNYYEEQAQPQPQPPNQNQFQNYSRSVSSQSYSTNTFALSQSQSQSHSQQSHEDLMDPPDIRADGTRSSTPLTATSSTHPTPPFSSVGVFTRSLNSTSPVQRVPVSYADDFGLKNLMAIIDVRSRDWSAPAPGRRPKSKVEVGKEVDEVEKMFWGERVEMEGVHPDIKECFSGLAERLGKFDREVDDLLAMIPTSRDRVQATGS